MIQSSLPGGDLGGFVDENLLHGSFDEHDVVADVDEVVGDDFAAANVSMRGFACDSMEEGANGLVDDDELDAWDVEISLFLVMGEGWGAAFEPKCFWINIDVVKTKELFKNIKRKFNINTIYKRWITATAL